MRKRKKRKDFLNKAWLLIILLFISLITISVYIIDSFNNVEEVPSQKLSTNVINLKPKIEEELNNQNLSSKHLPYMLAILQQESGGRGNDPFQASESKCGYIGCITNPDESVEAGVKAYKRILKYAKRSGFRNPSPELIIQSYNYGNGYMDYLNENNLPDYSKKSAKDFSKSLCGTAGTSKRTAVNEDKTACYGDYNYVERVLNYLD